jgi:hypothetical protein
MIRLLHIINDEKFLNSTINQFLSVDGAESVFLIPVKQISDSKHLHPDYQNEERIKCSLYQSKDYFKIIEKYEPDYLIVHGLSIEHKLALIHLKGKYPVVWSSWGRDVFSMRQLQHLMYKLKTRDLVSNLQRKSPLRVFLGRCFYWFLRKELRIKKDSQYYLKYISIISTVVKEDYEALIREYPKASLIKYIPFNYGIFLPFISEIKEKKKNIQIGNSANPENNHLECFELLENIYLGDRKVIVPLSYGGNKEYINFILQKGEEKLGVNFNPIVNFMPLPDYNELLDTVGFAIMNQSHQHAMGNIWYLLGNGVNVFMDFNNTAAQCLIRIGAKISNVEDLEDNALVPLSIEEMNHNHDIIVNNYGEQAIKYRTQGFVDNLKSALH